ncbi:ribosome biogenesis protein [Candidatus Woesearchaeota archaeon CG11_big_fil_rev_8_21_14_0_20_43_8]|nr:MAG: ribosome biogenesis protein [Candidatus Woesearchaeota archaeon CG11_big_fil_rev_8_21_14_0_20_43_8]PIO04594.1 MAG: ribosome biogenesis protein [Candidatus Woesearchaeota archaeon CG08_land_8_20_14_0_20_43_7]
MKTNILRCEKCGKYTLKKSCSGCGTDTISPIPPKYSPEDKYARFRRSEKRKQFEERGWL